MTGQSINHIANIAALSSEGLTRSEIAAKLGLSYQYASRLMREAGLGRSTTTKHSLVRIRELAEQGLTRAQISESTGLGYCYLSKIASQADFHISRQAYAGAESADSARVQQMADLYKGGRTLEQIGLRFDISRERVRQILTKHLGFSASSGVQHARVEQKRVRFELKRNQKCLNRWGCNWDQYTELRSIRKPTTAYASQKRNAAKRGIDWDLTLWQWWSIWQQSGRWADRGRGRGFQMCRIGDQGPYSVDNVYIASGSVNIQDYWADVKSGARTRTLSSRASVSPKVSKELMKAAVARYQKTPKYKLRYELRRQGIPKEQRDAIVAQRFGGAA